MDASSQLPTPTATWRPEEGHWGRFPAAGSWVHQGVAAVMTFITLVSLAGNTLVIWILSRYRTIRGPERQLFINLAVSNLLLTFTFPLYISSSLEHRWLFSVEGCWFYAAFSGCCALASINTMAAIGLDRMFVVSRYNTTHWGEGQMRMSIALVVIWLTAALWMLAPFFGWGNYIMDGFGATCTYDYLTRSTTNVSFVMMMMVGEFVLPLILMAYSYVTIIRSVHQCKKEIARSSNRLQRKIKAGSKYKRHLTEVKVAKVAITTIIFYCASWTPYVVMTFIGLFGNRLLVTPQLSAVVGILAKMSAIYNPFIYCISHQRFKRAVFRAVAKTLNLGNHSVSNTVTLTGMINNMSPNILNWVTTLNGSSYTISVGVKGNENTPCLAEMMSCNLESTLGEMTNVKDGSMSL